jgi:hypothetical protein
MKQSDIDRLKEKLGDEFELVTQSPDENDKFFVVIAKKKDPWKGVEFAESTWSGNILPVNQIDDFENSHIIYFKPSTEAAYVEQLKSKAKKLYGQIKEGDLFSSLFYPECNHTVERSDLQWDYDKLNDCLVLNGFPVYHQGKWAKKIERFKVYSNGGSINSQAFFFRWGQKEKEKMQDIGFVELCDYLAKCLEDKLNEK